MWELASFWPQVWPISSFLGLASSPGPFDYAHGLGPFFLVLLEGVCSCDSSVLPRAQSEGFWLALREAADSVVRPVSHWGTGFGGGEGETAGKGASSGWDGMGWRVQVGRMGRARSS